MSAELRIIPAKKYVRLHYQPCLTLDDVVKKLNEQTARTQGNDFVECLMYSLNSGVVMTGTMTDDVESDKVCCILCN